MEVKGKIKLFVRSKNYQDRVFNTYSTSVSSKDANGGYINATLEVKFDKECFSEEIFNRFEEGFYYVLDLTESWLSCRAYVRNDGSEARAIYLFVKHANYLEKNRIVGTDIRETRDISDIPF